MYRLLMIILAAGMLTSCGFKKTFSKTKIDSTYVKYVDSIRIKDSVVVKTQIKDSVVIREGVEGTDSMPCVKGQTTTIRRGSDIIKVSIDSQGQVKVSYKLAPSYDRYRSQSEMLKQTLNEYKLKIDSLSSVKIDKQVITKEVNVYPPWWTYPLIFALGVFVAILAKYLKAVVIL